MAIANENMIANGEIPVEQPVRQPAGLSMEQLDHEFLGRGDPQVEGLRLGEQYEKNLTPEELTRMKQLAPAVEEFFILDHKGRTGELPEGEREMPEGSLPAEEEITVEEYGDLYNAENKEEVLAELFGQKQPLQPQGADIPPKEVKRETPPPTPAPAPQPVVEAARGLEVPAMPQEDMVNTDANPQKNGMIDVPGKSNTGIADDVPMDLPEGSFVINAAAVEFAGLTDIEQMIKKAEEEEARLINQGTLKQTDQGGKTPVLVSNREVVIRPNIAKIIGLDKLEKINNRGKAETERAIQEEQLAEGNPQPERVQSPKGRMT
tara:strand:- start:50 stop:1009 length:960 start_codon:yes stop_codon:yes gene_type:complete